MATKPKARRRGRLPIPPPPRPPRPMFSEAQQAHIRGMIAHVGAAITEALDRKIVDQVSTLTSMIADQGSRLRLLNQTIEGWRYQSADQLATAQDKVVNTALKAVADAISQRATVYR